MKHIWRIKVFYVAFMIQSALYGALKRRTPMQYDPDDLIIVSCKNGHEHQMHSDAVPSETSCPFCGGNVHEVEYVAFNLGKETCTSITARS
jgi:hypothetical protein